MSPKRTSDDEEDREDRPRKKKRRPSRRGGGGGGGKGLVLFLLFGGLLLLGGGTALGVWLLVGGGGGGLLGGGGGGSSSVLKYMPDGLRELKVVASRELLAHPDYQALKKHYPIRSEVETGDFSLDIDRKNVTRVIQGDSQMGKLAVVHLETATTTAEVLTRNDMSKILRGHSWVEEKVGKYSIRYSSGADGWGRDAFCVVEPKVLLVGEHKAIKHVLERPGSPVQTEPMQAALALADFQKPLVSISCYRDQNISGGKPLTIEVNISPTVKKPRVLARVFQVGLSPPGSMTSTTSYVCDDPQALRTTINEETAKGITAAGGDGARSLFENQTYSVSENVLTVRNSQSIAAMAQWVEKHKSGLPLRMSIGWW